MGRAGGKRRYNSRRSREGCRFSCCRCRCCCRCSRYAFATRVSPLSEEKERLTMLLINGLEFSGVPKLGPARLGSVRSAWLGSLFSQAVGVRSRSLARTRGPRKNISCFRAPRESIYSPAQITHRIHKFAEAVRPTKRRPSLIRRHDETVIHLWVPNHSFSSFFLFFFLYPNFLPFFLFFFGFSFLSLSFEHSRIMLDRGVARVRNFSN